MEMEKLTDLSIKLIELKKSLHPDRTQFDMDFWIDINKVLIKIEKLIKIDEMKKKYVNDK